jgi:hypothetical protein
MKRLLWLLAVLIVPAMLAGAGLLLIAHSARSAPAAAPGQTATLRPAASPSPAATHRASGRPRTTRNHRPRPHHAGPWAVVSAYYRDIGSHKYIRAWALVRPALATGQTFQQFVAGYTCTGREQPTRLSQTGDQVSFNLTVANHCTGADQYYTGTDTVRGGKIVEANVTQTG